MDNLKLIILDKKEKLSLLEKKIEENLNNLKIQEELFHEIDKVINNLIKIRGDEIITINCSGEIHKAKLNTLLSVKNTFFYKLYYNKTINNKFINNDVLYIDRNPKYFLKVLDYLRYNNIDIKSLSDNEKFDLLSEAKYFKLYELIKIIGEFNQILEIVSYEHTNDYKYKDKIAGTGKVEDLSDRSLQKGICSNSPGMIMFTLNNKFTITELEIGGFCGNTSLWNPSNGEGANISTSIDKQNWTIVGIIPNGFGKEIQKANIKTSTAKFIKFSSSNYLGIGYLSIKYK